MSNKAIITVKDKEVTLTIKNLCSLYFNKETQILSFISSNLNIQEKIDQYSSNIKSVNFLFDKQIKPEPEDEAGFFGPHFANRNLYQHLVIHKSFRNNYELKKGSGARYKDLFYLTMPSKMFKHFRYAMYDISRSYIYSQTQFDIGFRCKETKYKIGLHNNQICLLEAIPNNSVKYTPIDNYISKQQYTIFNVGDRTFHLASIFNRSFCFDKTYCCFSKDLSNMFDKWNYFLEKPYTDEELKLDFERKGIVEGLIW